ncbi:MAG: hypothetical protein ACPGED_01990, partial [Flavobacteriales bacterium]
MKKSLLPFLLLSGALLLSTTCAAQHCCSKAGHHLMGMTKTASATRSDSLDVQHTHLYLDMTNT